MPYFAVVNRQGRYTVTGDTLQPAAGDALSAELASEGLDGLRSRLPAVTP